MRRRKDRATFYSPQPRCPLLGSSGTFLPVRGNTMTERVIFDDVSLVYPGATEPSVSHLNLDIEPGEFLVLVGPSGCG